MKNIKRLRVEKLVKASNQYPYLLIRTTDNVCFGVNSKAIKLAFKQTNPKLKALTRYQSYKPISFQEYISRKTAFI